MDPGVIVTSDGLDPNILLGSQKQQRQNVVGIPSLHVKHKITRLYSIAPFLHHALQALPRLLQYSARVFITVVENAPKCVASQLTQTHEYRLRRSDAEQYC